MHLNTLEIILGIILALLALGLVIVIAMQQSKKGGLGSIMGGSSDSYYGRNKARSKENVLKKLTVIFAVALAVLALILYAYHGSTSGTSNNSGAASNTSSAVSTVSDSSSDASDASDASDVSEEPSDVSEASADGSEDGSAAE